MIRHLSSRVKRSVYLGAAGEVHTPLYVKHPKTAAVIGAPQTWGQPLLGTDLGPDLVRRKGLREELTKLQWRVEMQKDIVFPEPKTDDPPAENARNCFAVGQGNMRLCETVRDAIKSEKFALTLGGDHSVGIGTCAGALQANPDVGFLWVDAHADINTPETSPSGNMHGMPIGLLMRLTDPVQLPGFEWMANVPRLDPKRLAYVALRDLDPAEVEAIRSLGICAFTMKDIDHYGIGEVMSRALEHLGQRPLHVSFDIDACDPLVAPASGTLVRGGLTWREAHYVAEAASDTGLVASLDMVEVNPMLSSGDMSDMTAELALALISSTMGSRIL